MGESARKRAIEWTNWVRDQELESLKDWIKPSENGANKLLEIGGGNGFLAKRLYEIGFNVVSIDPKPRQPSWFPVHEGDCCNMEFEDESFDVIFSSNVLEHISDLPMALGEMKRVLKSNGIMVHTMPTPFNTFLTILSAPKGYLFTLGRIIGEAAKFVAQSISSRRRASDSTASKNDKSMRKKFLGSYRLYRLAVVVIQLNPLRLIFPPPHGVEPSFIMELRNWKPQVWRKKFEQEDLCVRAVINLPLAYSRYMVFPFRFVSLRRRLAAAGKTSCLAYVLQK